MHYDNFIKRFILRKDFFKRAKNRLKLLKRKNLKNEFDDMKYLYYLRNKEPEVIFDCGANIGFVTHKFIEKFSKAHIYAFEPNPSVFDKLNHHYSGNDYVHCFNMGIGDKSGEMVFYINKNSGTSSFLRPTEYHTSNIASKKITPKNVEITTIDEIMSKENLKHIDILKLDIEGFELNALKGIKNIEEKVSIVYLEVNLIPTYEDQPLIEDLIKYLRNANFHLYNFYGINENNHYQATITNLLFISNKFKNKLVANGYGLSFSY